MIKIINFFSGKYVFSIVTLFFLFFVIIILPDQGAKAAEYTPENGSFDTSFYYQPSSVYEKIEDYGGEGRIYPFNVYSLGGHPGKMADCFYRYDSGCNPIIINWN